MKYLHIQIDFKQHQKSKSNIIISKYPYHYQCNKLQMISKALKANFNFSKVKLAYSKKIMTLY